MRRPPRGASVTFMSRMTGSGPSDSTEKRCATHIMISGASSIANCLPMQVRVPAPNGR
jgi:hypothetical protein